MSGVIFLLLRIALTLTLYIFLGWALLTLWRDLKHQREVLATQQVPSIGLHIQIGETSRTQRFTGPEIAIGRDPVCECSLNSETVSAHHAHLSFHNTQWWVEDMNSTNGTFLNSEPVSAPTVISQNDKLRCGDVLLTVLVDQ